MQSIFVSVSVTHEQMLDLLLGWGFIVRECRGGLRAYRNGRDCGMAEDVFWSKFSPLLQDFAMVDGMRKQ